MADVTLLRINAGFPPTRHVMDEKVAEHLLKLDFYAKEEDWATDPRNVHNTAQVTKEPALSPAGETVPDEDCVGCAEKRAAVEAVEAEITKEQGELATLEAPAEKVS